MPTTRKRTTTRTTRAKKPTTAPPMVDTKEETIEDAEPRVAPPREQKAGPKKVLSETAKAIADAGAVVLTVQSAGNDGKGLQFAEAQSITHPLTRMVGRRIKKWVPDWAKQYIPTKVKLDPDDMADLEEIAVTLGKYALRIMAMMVREFVMSKEQAQAAKQRAAATGMGAPARPAPAPAYENPIDQQMPEVFGQEAESSAPVGQVSSNGHNPAFDAIGADFGIEA